MINELYAAAIEVKALIWLTLTEFSWELAIEHDANRLDISIGIRDELRKSCCKEISGIGWVLGDINAELPEEGE